MSRIVPVAAFAAGITLVTAGCGTENAAPPPVSPAAVMSGGILSGREVPKGFLPAENHEVFKGMRPADPDCVRLLRLADVNGARDVTGVRGVPEAHAAFYRADPGASLVQHVFRLSPGQAAQHIAQTRRAATRCPKIKDETGNETLTLNRERLRRPKGAPGGLSIRYAGARKKQNGIGLDIVMMRAADDLLVMASPGEDSGSRMLERVAAKALTKLRSVPATP